MGPKRRAFDLEIAIAVESGDWESLGATLSAYLESDADQTGLSLIRAAHLAQASSQGPMMALAEAAVVASPNDPNVLMGAYTLVLEQGLDDKKPAAAQWFRRALDLSGPDGPIKRFELKDLLVRQLNWNDQTRQINDALLHGDMPLFVAATGLRTSLAELMLRNFARNSTIADPRRRVVIPVFSGRHLPRQLPETKRLALDISALMTLGWLGLLSRVIAAYPEIVIPAGALGELFEAQRCIREFQASRIARAQQVNEAVDSGRLKVLHADAGGDDLAKEVGIEVAALIEAAESRNGILLRPSPIRQLGLEEKDADMSAHAPVLADMHALLTVLVDMAALDQSSEETARRFFEVQDRGWPASAAPSKDRPLFLDGLSVVYLQTANLLDTVLDRFEVVYVHSSTQEEASSIVAYDHHSHDILRVIGDIRDAVRQGSQARKVIFGPRTAGRNSEGDWPDLSSMHLLGDLAGTDIAIIDDRAMNRETVAVDSTGHSAHILNSLDVIDDLRMKGVLSESERNILRHRLRFAGAVLVPVDADEIAAAALRNRQNESPEFRAIRESIGVARVAEVPQFPAEIQWFASLASAIKSAIMSVWTREPDAARAASVADAILDMRPSPEDWIAGWSGNPPPEWIESVRQVMAAGLVMPFEIDGEEAMAVYNEWLERRFLAPLRVAAPDHYQALVGHIKAFIATSWKDQDDPRRMALFALAKLSDALHSDVLADGSLARRFDLHPIQTIQFDDLVLRRDQLLQAFRDAADNAPVQLRIDESGTPLQAKVSIDAEGTGIVETSKKHWRFEYAAFLSGRRDIRLAALDKCIAAHTLSTRDRERLRQLAGQADITNDDFAVLAEIVASSPESFAFMLRERVAREKIEKNDLLPRDLRHWEHLVPPVERSTTLDQYIASELEAEWRARLTVSQPLGLASIALTFAAPALIPRGLIESLPLDKAVAFIEGACAFDDPFGLVGALQTCADRVVGDARFVVLGERLLDRLFGNMDRLTTACQLFAAAFIIATAHLSEHETLGRQPVYWRRLAAASHASLVVRTCGISDAKQDGLIPWAVLVSGDTYLLSVLSDFSEQPRWRPEWITDDFLVADIYGRALSALSGIPSEHVPAGWQTRLDQVKAWAYKTPMEIKAHFPAVLEGARRSELPDLSKLEPVGGVLRPLIDEPSPEHLLMISFVIYTFGFPPELRDKIIAVVCQIRHSPLTLDDRQMQQVISIASHIAAETRDPELADAITDTCIAKVVAATELQAATEAMFRLVECAAACQSRSAAAPQLAERLERLAFVLPTAAMCKRLASLLGCLKTVQPELAPLLGRALAAANLGGNRSGG